MKVKKGSLGKDEGFTVTRLDKAKAFTEPFIEIEELLDEDSVFMSEGFNGQHDYDPSAEWED